MLLLNVWHAIIGQWTRGDFLEAQWAFDWTALCGFSPCLPVTVTPNYCGLKWENDPCGAIWLPTTCLVVDGMGAFHHKLFCLRFLFFGLTQLQLSSLGLYYTILGLAL